MSERELAWRIFAGEFNRANLRHSQGTDRAPHYIVTPTGAKCNRLFVVGVATEIDNIGTEENLWRARISDPTGVFTIYAGQYQPEATTFFSELQIPAFVAVTGKARIYEPEDGTVYTSIRPEEANIVNADVRDRWILNTAERTMERVNAMKLALSSNLHGEGLRDYLRGKVSAELADGVVMALDHYQITEAYLHQLVDMVGGAVKAVSKGVSQTPEYIIAKPTLPRAAGGKKEGEYIIAGLGGKGTVKKVPEPKEVVFGLLEKMDQGDGVTYLNLVDAARGHNLSGDTAETAVRELMDEGRCYEPKIGILKKV
ncbi:MAG: DNA-binding protein [Methanosarcinales archaeon]|nr:MAG: DNA-binding protein [Methanosarcinales archaeon]